MGDISFQTSLLLLYRGAIYNYGSTQLRVSALTSVIKPELNQKSDIITAPNMSSVCNTSRPQLCVVDNMVMNNGMRAVLSPTEYSTAEQIQMWLILPGTVRSNVLCKRTISCSAGKFLLVSLAPVSACGNLCQSVMGFS